MQLFKTKIGTGIGRSGGQFLLLLLCIWLLIISCNTVLGDEEEDGDDDFDELDETAKMRKLAMKHGINPDDPKSGTVMLSPPQLSPEEQGSQFMPKAHQCNACTAIAYLLTKNFKATEKKKKKGQSLTETDILDVTDDLCESEFQGYGLKNVQGTNYLSGEGLEADEMAGMMEAGGKWAKRFQNMCKEIMGEYEEQDVYNFYNKKDDHPLKSHICGQYCPFDDDDDDDDDATRDEF